MPQPETENGTVLASFLEFFRDLNVVLSDKVFACGMILI